MKGTLNMKSLLSVLAIVAAMSASAASYTIPGTTTGGVFTNTAGESASLDRLDVQGVLPVNATGSVSFVFDGITNTRTLVANGGAVSVDFKNERKVRIGATVLVGGVTFVVPAPAILNSIEGFGADTAAATATVKVAQGLATNSYTLATLTGYVVTSNALPILQDASVVVTAHGTNAGTYVASTTVLPSPVTVHKNTRTEVRLGTNTGARVSIGASK